MSKPTTPAELAQWADETARRLRRTLAGRPAWQADEAPFIEAWQQLDAFAAAMLPARDAERFNSEPFEVLRQQALQRLPQHVLRLLDKAARLADPEPARDADPPAGSDKSSRPDLGDAKRAILTVLGRSDRPMPNKAIAKEAGYSDGSLRHHYSQLKAWGYVEAVKGGYAITPAGRAILSSEAPRCERV